MNGEIVHSGNATPCLRDIMFTHFLDHYGLISHVHLPDCNGPKYDHGQNAESHWYAISRHWYVKQYINATRQYAPCIGPRTRHDGYRKSYYLLHIASRSMKVAWHKVKGTPVQNYQFHLSKLLDTLGDTGAVQIHWFKKVQAVHSNQRNERRVYIEVGRPRGMQFVTYANYKHAQKMFASE